jgi:hypothetical protein
MKFRILERFGVAIIGFTLAACGGSGGSGNIAGIDRLGVTGPITGFGSVIVNGVEWRTNAATFSIDGQSGRSETELQIGQVVTIKGKPDADGKGGAADSVSLQNNVVGKVLAVNPLNNTFAILGQTIIVDADTSTDPGLPGTGIDAISVFNPASPYALAVSGFVDSLGLIHATRVQIIDPLPATESVVGKVGNVNASAKTLTIGGLTVNYGGATLSGFPGNDPVAGDVVHASGSFDGTLLTATSLAFQQRTAPAASGEDGEVEGLVSAFTSTSNFQINGVTVLTNSSTQYEPTGTSASDIKLNAKLEAKGPVDSSGRIVASRISFKASSGEQQIEIVANVESTNVAANTLNVFGISVQLNGDTRLEDKSNADKRPFRLSDIAVGDQLRIRGQRPSNAASNSMIATRVDREEIDQGDIVLQGVVAQKNGTSGLVVLGAEIVVDNIGTEFFDANGQRVQTAPEFFNLVTEGTTVVRGESTASSVNGTTITANILRIVPAQSDN